MSVNEVPFHVVIRSSGERTSKLLEAQVLDQCGGYGGCTVINSVPFESAMRIGYEVGIQNGKTWTITLDGDIVLRRNALDIFLHKLNLMSENVLQVECRMFDHLLGFHRNVGHRAFRTVYLNALIDCIPETGSQIRPEAFAIKTLQNRMNLKSLQFSEVLGVHDYLQFKRDLVRKVVVHAFKHRGSLLEGIRLGRNDWHKDERLVVLLSLVNAIDLEVVPTIDIKRYKHLANQIIEDLGGQEYPEISSNFDLDVYYELCEGLIKSSLDMGANARQKMLWYVKRYGFFTGFCRFFHVRAADLNV